jgi:hypothetical protein
VGSIRDVYPQRRNLNTKIKGPVLIRTIGQVKAENSQHEKHGLQKLKQELRGSVQKGYGSTLTSFWETTERCLGTH